MPSTRRADPGANGSTAWVSLRYVSMLEQNARNLSIESLNKIANCLNVDIAELVCDTKYLDHAKKSAAELGIELLRQFVKEAE